MLSSEKLNGDFVAFGYDLFWLILSYFLSFIPYIFFILFISNQKTSKYVSISSIRYFEIFTICILLLQIFLAVVYKVGLYAQSQIYQVPILLKPIIVVLNKLDTYTLAALVIISVRFNVKTKITVASLLIILAVSRASIIVFLFLFLLLVGCGKIKFKLIPILMMYFLFILSIQYLPILFEFREKLRTGSTDNKSEIFDNKELTEFMKAKVIGRVSGLSPIVYFFQNHNSIDNTKHEVGMFEYVIEGMRPFYGGIIRENKIGYTYYFTNLYDNKTGTDYGIMYGLPTVFLLSYLKGIHVLIINLIFICSIIFLIVKLSSYLFGRVYKQLIFVILFYPLTSGVSSEFGQILLYLLVLSFIKLIYISTLKKKSNSLLHLLKHDL